MNIREKKNSFPEKVTILIVKLTIKKLSNVTFIMAITTNGITSDSACGFILLHQGWVLGFR